jgi:NADH:ubiquinone oxidoreductase subunit B-like Fe-S oxidoreductase
MLELSDDWNCEKCLVHFDFFLACCRVEYLVLVALNGSHQNFGFDRAALCVSVVYEIFVIVTTVRQLKLE